MSNSRSFAPFRDSLRQLADRPLAPSARGYWVYGAGNFGRSVTAELVRIGEKVLGFVDVKGRELKTVDGVPCRHPDDLTSTEISGSHYVHGLMNHYSPSADVAAWAQGKGFDEVVFVSRLFKVPGFALENYWLTDSAATTGALDEIEALHDTLDDDESREVLKSLLLYRLSSDPRLHPEFEARNVYVPDFMPIFDRPITFVDAGAYTGDTLELLLANGVAVRDWIAFEPDEKNAEDLRRTAHRLRDRVPSYTLLQAGLSDQSGIVRFSSSGSQSSRVLSGDVAASETGITTEIPVVRLDDTARRSGDVYVKMDIEGAERAALAGMPELMKQRPMLAISIYHQPSDLWAIPRMIASVYDRPRMRIRQHCHHAFETVLYVWPE